MSITDRGSTNVIIYDENGNAAAVDSFSSGQIVSNRYGNVSSFMASTNGSVGSGTTAATVTSIGYLWHPSSNTKRIEINRIDVSWGGGVAGNLVVRGAFITAENGTPGGTSQTINPTDRADSGSAGMVFRTGATGAPTRAAGDLISWGAGGAATEAYFSWIPSLTTKPIVLRASQNEGFEIRTVIGTALTTAAQVSVTFYWTEK